MTGLHKNRVAKYILTKYANELKNPYKIIEYKILPNFISCITINVVNKTTTMWCIIVLSAILLTMNNEQKSVTA